MNKTAAWLACYALEQLGVKHTLGIPGVHNTELYDELNKSEKIEPVLVGHEGGASFMADAISRTSETIGTLVIVPAAGVTHAASGIGEAFLDGIPLLIIAGGVRTDSGAAYQLHDMDQHSLLKPITKATFHPKTHAEVVPAIFEAYQIATSAEPGPVFVEIPVNLQLFPGEVKTLPVFQGEKPQQPMPAEEELQKALQLLMEAENPGLFLGWGARHARQWSKKIASRLGAPVATTLQGLASFPGDHPLHTGMGFNRSAVPAAENAFKDCDVMLAVGTRFSEIPTGSFGAVPPEKLIHVDINPQVFNANYPAEVSVQGDSAVILQGLWEMLDQALPENRTRVEVREQIAADKQAYRREWREHNSAERVNPQVFFEALDQTIDQQAIVVADDGNHTFLTAELLPMAGERQFISPTDFNAMGYCVPAVNGAKLANPDKTVVGIVGDGAFLMTGMEILTARAKQLGVVYFVFSDGELSQIAQAQAIPYNRKTCSVLPDLNMQAMAQALGCEFLAINNNDDVSPSVTQALKLAAENKTVLVNVNIDYSKPTRFTTGTVKTNLERFSPANKARFIGRALWRKITG